MVYKATSETMGGLNSYTSLFYQPGGRGGIKATNRKWVFYCYNIIICFNNIIITVNVKHDFIIYFELVIFTEFYNLQNL